MSEPRLFILDRPERRASLLRVIQHLPLEDGQIWDVRIKEWEPKRSTAQNARLHLIFSEVAKFTGSDVESVKLGYKAMFLPGKESESLGRKVVIYPKTSRMSVKMLNEFMAAVEAHAISEFGVLVGDSNYAY